MGIFDRFRQNSGRLPHPALAHDALLAELGTAKLLLDACAADFPPAVRALTEAAFQALLAHAAQAAIRAATPTAAADQAAYLLETVRSASPLSAGDFTAIWTIAQQWLDREPPTSESAISTWARMVFALRDGGFNAWHLTDYLWVSYAGMVYPEFMVRVHRAIKGPAQSPADSVRTLANAAVAFREQSLTLSAQVLEEQADDTEKRRTFGAVLMEKNLRALQYPHSLVQEREDQLRGRR